MRKAATAVGNQPGGIASPRAAGHRLRSMSLAEIGVDPPGPRNHPVIQPLPGLSLREGSATCLPLFLTSASSPGILSQFPASLRRTESVTETREGSPRLHKGFGIACPATDVPLMIPPGR